MSSKIVLRTLDDGTVVKKKLIKKRKTDAPVALSAPSADAAPSSPPAKKLKKANAAKVIETSTTSTTQNTATVTKPPRGKLTRWDWYRSIGSPRWVLSPMVGQSELAFRMLVRERMQRAADNAGVPEQGKILAYTPMIIASKFVESEAYRNAVFQTCPEDRPLVVQFCANDPSMFVAAAKLVQDKCDAVDLNLGCPQEVARRGGYGSWMMERQELIRSIISRGAKELNVPVTAKIRVFESFRETLQYVRVLEEAGISLLTVHGRMRHMREEVLSDWGAAHRLRPHLHVPVILNGDVWDAEDLAMCLADHDVDGVMSAQGILHNPAIFEPLLGHPLLPPPPASNEHEPDAGDKKKKSKDPLAMARAKAMAGPATFQFAAPVPDSRFRVRRQFSPYLSFSLNSIYRHPLTGLGTVDISRGRAQTRNAGLVEAFKKPMTTPEDSKRQLELAAQYIDMVERYPVAHGSMVRRHLFFILFDNFQANLDVYDDLYVSDSLEQWRNIVSTLETRAKLGKNCKNPSPECKATGKPRATRRDGTVAPPPWPTGGGGMNVNETKTAVFDDEDDSLEVVGKGGVKKVVDEKKGKGQGKKKQNRDSDQGSSKMVRKVDTSKMDLSRFD